MNASETLKSSLNSDISIAKVNISPRVDLLTDIKDDELKFTLSGVNVSIANSLRRILLSEIPMVVFKVAPNDKNKCTVITNTCGLHNEIVKHRLSCIPINITNTEDFNLKKYILEINVQNDTDTTIYVTSKDFRLKEVGTENYLPEEELRKIFPPNPTTNDYIDFVRLKPKPAEEIKSKTIHLTCEFDIGTAHEDGAYNAVSTCAYGNTIDVPAQEAKLQQLKHTWKETDGKNVKEVEFEAVNWKLLEGKRIFKKDSFDFIIQTVGVYTNYELMDISCKIMMNKLKNLGSIIEKNELEVKVADNTMKNCYDIILDHEDYTVGKVIEYFMNVNFYETKMLTFCGFKMSHPHDTYCTIRVAYKEPMELTSVKGHVTECVVDSIEVFKKINKEFMKLVPR